MKVRWTLQNGSNQIKELLRGISKMLNALGTDTPLRPDSYNRCERVMGHCAFGRLFRDIALSRLRVKLRRAKGRALRAARVRSDLVYPSTKFRRKDKRNHGVANAMPRPSNGTARDRFVRHVGLPQ